MYHVDIHSILFMHTLHTCCTFDQLLVTPRLHLSFASQGFSRQWEGGVDRSFQN